MQTILIVDDEAMMLRIASKILAKKYRTVCASSGAEAVELFAAEKPDMVLSDLLMPEMDGYELHRILQEKAAEPVPVMFMTADDSDESESHGFEIGAADYIRKPLKADILLRRVENILDNADKLQDLKQAVDLDTMTGLLNKTAAQREFEKICATARGVLMMIDLDSFKLVNDIHGHAMGDRILVKLSELIHDVTGAADLAGRIGGDEFMIFCNGVSSENDVAAKTNYLNRKILDAAKKYIGAEMNIPLGVSVGAVFVPDEGADFKILSAKADKALYKVKQNGKHGYAVYSGENSDAAADEVSDIWKILGEREHTSGAYFVEPNYFKAIYQLVARLVDSCKREAQFMQFALDSELDAVAEEFRDLLIKNLRMSDCVTQAGRNKFLALLPETKPAELNIIKIKLQAKISASKTLAACKIRVDAKAVQV